MPLFQGGAAPQSPYAAGGGAGAQIDPRLLAIMMQGSMGGAPGGAGVTSGAAGPPGASGLASPGGPGMPTGPGSPMGMPGGPGMPGQPSGMAMGGGHGTGGAKPPPAAQGQSQGGAGAMQPGTPGFKQMLDMLQQLHDQKSMAGGVGASGAGPNINNPASIMGMPSQYPGGGQPQIPPGWSNSIMRAGSQPIQAPAQLPQPPSGMYQPQMLQPTGQS